jgi:ADP-ribose pyrophosphatase
MAWEILDSEIVIDRQPWLRVIAEKVRLPDGRTIDNFFRVEHALSL